jgi:hypothetical protein
LGVVCESPDKPGGNHSKFLQIQEAYDKLSQKLEPPGDNTKTYAY